MNEPKNIIVEMIPVGNFIKVSAICEQTGTEVSIVGDPSAPKAALRAAAIRKLEYVMKRGQHDNVAQDHTVRGIEV